MTRFTDTEIAYDISRIPAVSAAMAHMPTGKLIDGFGPVWESLLEAAARVMDNELRETLHDQAFQSELSPATFLTIYAARHEARFGERFDF